MRTLSRHVDQVGERNRRPPLEARDLDLFSPDEWQGFNAEVIEIRKMTYSYRRNMLANEKKKAGDKNPNDKRSGGKNKGAASEAPDS